MPHQPETYDVLVVGAGPAGLTTATGLARAGVRVLIIDKHASTSVFPKATGVRPRTMEILRSWGLEQRVHAAGQDVRLQLAVSPVLSAPVVAVESLGVPDPAQICAVSPSRFAFVPQDLLEPVLLGHLRERGGHVRFRTELVGFDLGKDGVRARLRPRDGGGPAYEVRARYLVGADGPRSTVRAGLGVDVEQLGVEGEHLTALFTADLGRVLPDPPFALHWVTAPGAEGTFVAAGRHRWTYGWDKDRGTAASPHRRPAGSASASAPPPAFPVSAFAFSACSPGPSVPRLPPATGPAGGSSWATPQPGRPPAVLPA